MIAEAREWIGTPYVECAAVKGRNGGVDCLTFLALVFQNSGAVEKFEIPSYSPQWHLNRTEELYLNGILQYCDEIEGNPQPGDIAMWKFGNCFSHAAIVLGWPEIIHAWCRRPVSPDDALGWYTLTHINEIHELRGQPRPRRFFTLKEWR